MLQLWFSLIVTLLLTFASIPGCATVDGKESWGYVEVRPGAHMFWWLYYANTSLNTYTKFPLVIWLQGGPGASSTGFGNFYEIGPYDIDMKVRKHSWINKANLLFIDNPVGTGFSYVDNATKLCKTNKEIGLDLVVMLKDFLEKVTEFQKVPLYIFSESYGGKMAVQFALQLVEELKADKIKTSFKGVVLGAPWISPVDYVSSWGRFLFAMSYVDKLGEAKLKDSSVEVFKAVTSGNFTEATKLWSQTEELVTNLTGGVSFYNIQYPIRKGSKFRNIQPNFENVMNVLLEPYDEDKLKKFMNTEIKEKLTVIPKNVTWGGQSDLVFKALQDSFMRSVTDVVETLLNTTSIPVSVYTGEFDLITNVLGTTNWLSSLNWPGKFQFYKASREPIFVSQILNIYKKKFKNLSHYSVLRAGHMVPIDNPEAGLKLLDLIFKS